MSALGVCVLKIEIKDSSLPTTNLKYGRQKEILAMFKAIILPIVGEKTMLKVSPTI